MTIDGDATALAQAVVGRTGGDIASARAVLAQADMILSQAGDRQPRMAADGGALKAVPEDNPGLGKLPEKVRNRMGYMNMGGPLYAAEGRAISDKDADMLRRMIMDSLSSVGQSGGAMSNKDLKDALTPTGRRAGQSGRAMSDKDMSYFYDSDLDAN